MLVDSPKKIYKNTDSEEILKSNFSKKWFWFLMIFVFIFLIVGVHHWSEERTKSARLQELESKLRNNEQLSTDERIEICNLWQKEVGLHLTDCENLSEQILIIYTNPCQKAQATVGKSSTKDYKKTFFEIYPTLKGKVIVHHAIEQQVLTLYPNLFSISEIHSLENLRGIPTNENNRLHLSILRREWDRFYLNHEDSTSREQILEFATELDKKYGNLFLPQLICE